MSPNQEIVYSEFRKLLLQERMNSFVDDQGGLNFNNEDQQWPEGLPLDYVADQIKDKLRYVDRRLRPMISRHLCKQLVERGDLVLNGNLLILPQQ